MHATHQRCLLNATAVFVMCAIVGAVIAALHFHARYADVHGPTAIAIGERIAVARHRAIDIVGLDGAPEATINTDALGVSPTQSDIVWLPDGRLLLSHGPQDQPVACDLAAARCDPLSGSETSGGPLRFAVNEDDLWMVDSNNHRVLRLAHDGPAQPGSIRQDLAFPNGIALAGERLLLCDTNHSRILAFPLDESGAAGPGEVLADDFALAGSLRIRPIAVAPAHGGVWVLVANPNMMDAVLLRLDGQGTAVARVDLPGAADPSGLRAWRGGALVADTNGLQLLEVSVDGVVAPFGPEGYARQLDELRAQRDADADANSAALGTLVAGLLGALAVVVAERRLRAAAGPPLTDGIRWLDGPRPAPLFARAMILGSLLLLPALMVTALALALFSPVLAALSLLAPWPAAAAIVYLGERQATRDPAAVAGLGIAPGHVVVRLGDGSVQHHPVRGIPWSKRALHLPDRLLLIRDAHGWRYPEVQVREWLLPHLDRRNRLGLG